MPAIPIQRVKRVHADGLIEINIWRVPEPVPPYKFLSVENLLVDFWKAVEHI